MSTLNYNWPYFFGYFWAFVLHIYKLMYSSIWTCWMRYYGSRAVKWLYLLSSFTDTNCVTLQVAQVVAFVKWQFDLHARWIYIYMYMYYWHTIMQNCFCNGYMICTGMSDCYVFNVVVYILNVCYFLWLNMKYMFLYSWYLCSIFLPNTIWKGNFLLLEALKWTDCP